MNEEQTRALIRAEIRAAFESMAAAGGAIIGDRVDRAIGRHVWDVADQVVVGLAAAEPQPVNPFAPNNSAHEWADRIRGLIAEAKADGYDVWVDVEDYFGPGPFVRVSPSDSDTWESDPIAWETGP